MVPSMISPTIHQRSPLIFLVIDLSPLYRVQRSDASFATVQITDNLCAVCCRTTRPIFDESSKTVKATTPRDYPMNMRTDTPLSPQRRPRSLALAVVDALGDRMRAGVLSPGDKLPTESEIMVEFGVSRTVVREALSKLQASGLV